MADESTGPGGKPAVKKLTTLETDSKKTPPKPKTNSTPADPHKDDPKGDIDQNPNHLGNH
jgi:hypothetical protein